MYKNYQKVIFLIFLNIIIVVKNMHIINSIRSYISDEEFKITILKDKINIVNYTSIGAIDDNKVMIKYDNGYVQITDMITTEAIDKIVLKADTLLKR